MTRTLKTKAKKAGSSKGRTKAAQVVGLLGRSTGASIAEMMKATGWQAQSVRGFLSGALKKRGLEITSNRETSGERRYRIQGKAQ